MKIPLEQTRTLLRHCAAVVVVDDDRPVLRPNTDYYINPDNDDNLFLTLDWTNDEGLEFKLRFNTKANQESDYDENYGGLTLIDTEGAEVSLRLLEVMRPRFDIGILYDMPLDRMVTKEDGIERFIPYDRLGYEYQQWLHKHRAALIKEDYRFVIDKKNEKVLKEE